MILLRHGETVFNVKFSVTRVDPGVEDPALTDNGRAQVEQATEMLRDQDLVRLVTSPYRRALETADIIASRLDIPVTIDERVRERFAYSCDIGTSKASLTETWSQFSFEHLSEIWWPADEEPEADLHARCRHFGTSMAQREDWAHTLVVSHWGFIRGLTGQRIKNCEMVRYDPVAGTIS